MSRAAWRRAWGRRAVTGVVASAQVLASRGAAAADGPAPTPGDAEKVACVETHTHVQRARREGRVLEARALARACAVPTCPRPVEEDCAALLAALDAEATRLVVAPEGAAVERLEVDGAPAASGEPVELAPGPHEIRVVARSGLVVVERLTLVAGEGTRRVVIVLPELAAPPPPAAPPTAAPLGGAREAATARARPRWVALSLGAVSAVAFGTFAGFGLSGARREAALEASCAPACAPARVDAMRRDYLVADVALGVGVVAAGAAVASMLLGY